MLDNVAVSLEQFGALLSWQDPLATALLAAFMLLLSALLWLLGLRALLVAALLFDMRPPIVR